MAVKGQISCCKPMIGNIIKAAVSCNLISMDAYMPSSRDCHCQSDIRLTAQTVTRVVDMYNVNVVIL